LAVHRCGPNGAIIAVVNMVGCVDLDAFLATEPYDDAFPWDEDQDGYLVGKWVWLLANARRVDPIPMRGRLGIWPLPPFVSTLLEARLAVK
jgi:hypothetical protein